MNITQRNLIKAFPKLSPKQALQITRLVNGTLDPETFDTAKRRIAECYNRPDDIDLVLTIVNEMIGGFGIEGVAFVSGAMFTKDYISYVNLGDTYTVTVLWSPRTNNFMISDWGSEYELSPSFEESSREDSEEQM